MKDIRIRLLPLPSERWRRQRDPQEQTAHAYLVSIKLENFYRIPWTTWHDMKQIYGRKHIKQAELEPFRLQYISGVIKMLEGIEISYTEEGDENEQ